MFNTLKSMNDPTIEKEGHHPIPKTVHMTKENIENPTDNWASRILKATSVSELLQLSENHLVKENAMQILTKLSVLTASNQANIMDFENDYRFLKICRIMSKPDKRNSFNQPKSAELEVILSVAGDEEASKIVESLSLPQKVKVFSSLARKKNRSIIVLKSLASTISSHTYRLNLKECSDLLFAIASLNFIDEQLLCRISIDILAQLDTNLDKKAVVGSIVTSLGFLKYKDPNLLDDLTKWIIDKQELFRPKDLASLVLTLALVNYRPKHVDDLKTKLLPKITSEDLSTNEWLDYIWALTVLNLHQSIHLESVLRYVGKMEFIHLH